MAEELLLKARTSAEDNLRTSPRTSALLDVVCHGETETVQKIYYKKRRNFAHAALAVPS
jgi:hypothetical protein